VILNWIFIYGELGAPAMGAEGAGLATFLARALGAAAAWVVWVKADFMKEVNAELKRQWGRSDLRKSIRQILKDGTGIGLQIIVEVSGFAFGAIMIGWIGATELAAHNVSINPAAITFMVAFGLGSAATIRVSRHRGEGNWKGARNAGIAALVIVLIYMVVVAAFYTLTRYELPKLYIADPAVIELASQLLLWAGAFSIFDGLQVVALGILRGYGDIRVPTIWAAISYLVVTIPAGYIFTFPLGMGPAGVWLGYLLGLMIACVAYLWRFRLIVNRPEMAAPQSEEVDPLPF
jgi:MATE family multidrug resistance protein